MKYMHKLAQYSRVSTDLGKSWDPGKLMVWTNSLEKSWDLDQKRDFPGKVLGKISSYSANDPGF